MACDQLFGPAYKGITLAAATAIALGRKGAQSAVQLQSQGSEGSRRRRQSSSARRLRGRVLIVDDVITGRDVGARIGRPDPRAGRDAGRRADRVGPDGARAGRASAVQEVRDKFGIPVVAIATLDDVMLFIAGPARVDGGGAGDRGLSGALRCAVGRSRHAASAGVAGRTRRRRRSWTRQGIRIEAGDRNGRDDKREQCRSKQPCAAMTKREHRAGRDRPRSPLRWCRVACARARHARRRTSGSTRRASSTTRTRCRRRPSTRPTSSSTSRAFRSRRPRQALTPEQRARDRAGASAQATARERRRKSPGATARSSRRTRARRRSISRGAARCRRSTGQSSRRRRYSEQLSKRKRTRGEEGRVRQGNR